MRGHKHELSGEKRERERGGERSKNRQNEDIGGSEKVKRRRELRTKGEKNRS